MKSVIAMTLLFVGLAYASFGQDPNDILKEGKKLFSLEKAAWHGTDYYLQNFPDKVADIGGYLTYEEEDQLVNIFYSKQDNNLILARLFFEGVSNPKPVKINSELTKASPLEADLIALREDALNSLASNTDGFFDYYEGTSYNTIPIITEQERKVYILTASQTAGVILLGNDYLLTYTKKNKQKKKIKIHNSLIKLPGKDAEGNSATSAIHSHVNSEYIDPTDICTLLLYKDYVDWKQHYVAGKKYVSIFDLEKETLAVITLKAWKKMTKGIE